MRRAVLSLAAPHRAGWLWVLAGLLMVASLSAVAAAPAKSKRAARPAAKAKPQAKTPATRTTPIVTVPGETDPEDEADLLERSATFWLSSGLTQGVGPISSWILSWAAKEQMYLKKAQVARQQGRAGEADSHLRQARICRNNWVHPVLPAPPPSAGGEGSSEGSGSPGYGGSGSPGYGGSGSISSGP